jgi:hypothetical protein
MTGERITAARIASTGTWQTWQARRLADTHRYLNRGNPGRCDQCPPIGPCAWWWWSERYLADRLIGDESLYDEGWWRRWRR